MGQITISDPNEKIILGQYLPAGSLRRRLTIYLGIPLLAILILVGIVDQIVMPIITRQGADFPLPTYVDMKVIEAEMQLEDLDLSYSIAGEEYAPGKDKGVILNQFPIAGTRVKPGRQIKFVISMGQKYLNIPQVAGKSVRQATLDLEAAGLLLGEVSWAFSDTIPERVVVFSYPAAGTEVPMGTKVNLMVNRGRASEYTYVPKVIGMQLEDAVKLLEKKGLKVGIVTYRTNDNYLPDTVLDQSEPEGTELTVGGKVDLIVTKT
jgi:serine/threonine-protein kinase